MNPNDEIVAIVDRENNITDALPRSIMRLNNLTHRASYILVFNTKKELFVQKRTPTKDVYPGYYDIATGGVVLAGETYEETAKRELAEEIGAKNIPLSVMFDFFYRDDHCQVWGRVFRCTYDGPIVLQKEEVESGEFFSIEKIKEMKTRHKFTPDGLYVLSRYLEPISEI